MGADYSLAPACIGWAFLPGNAATGKIADNAYGIVCNKAANPGQWECFMSNPVSLTDGSAVVMQGVGVPDDTNDGVYFTLGDNGVGNFELTVRRRSDNAPDDTQPVSFMIWRLPRLT